MVREDGDVVSGARENSLKADGVAVASLLSIALLVYAPFIRSLGFYWDDWPIVWSYQAFGARGLSRYYAGNRPAMGWLYAHVMPLFGAHTLRWQVGAVGLCIFASVAEYILFRILWPTRRDLAWLIAMAALLYPGFTQQSIAVTYFPHHLSLCFLLVSYALTAGSIRAPAYRYPLIGLSLLTEAGAYSLVEYYVGLEFLRPVILAIAAARRVNEDGAWSRARTSLIRWIPYALLWLAYVLWRIVLFHPSPELNYKDARGEWTQVLVNPIHQLSQRAYGAFHNILMGTVAAWARPFDLELTQVSFRATLLSWCIGALVVAVAIGTLRYLVKEERPLALPASVRPAPDGVAATCLLLAAVAVSAAAIPFALSNLSADFSLHPAFGDRITLPFAVGAALLIAGGMAAIGTETKRATWVMSVLFFAASAFQVANSTLYRLDWLEQKSIFWQLAWRAPALKAGTSVFAVGLPRSLYRNHMAGLLDLLYKQPDNAEGLSYFVFDTQDLQNDEGEQSIKGLSYRPGDPIVGTLRSFQFNGKTSQGLVIWISPEGTVRVVDEDRANENLRCSELCNNLAQLSHPRENIADSSAPPNGSFLRIFGRQSKPDWVYFYQKAELERQFGRWSSVAALGDRAMELGFQPRDCSEWFPFIEGYARANRLNTAEELSRQVLLVCPDAVAPLSALWTEVTAAREQDHAFTDGIRAAIGSELMLPNER